MIKYNPKLWFSHIFHVYKSDTLRILSLELIIIGLYTFLLNYGLHYFFPDLNFKLFKNAFTIHTLIGFVMGLLLVFRTNTAYDRWWEGRKQWGALVNNTRYLAIKINHLIPENEEKKTFINLIKHYPIALKNHLRDTIDFSEMQLPDHQKNKLQLFKNIPNGFIDLMMKQLVEWKKNKTISDIELLLLDKEVKNFIDIQGACERIKNTPIPFSYTVFIKKFIFIYVLTVPFGFLPDFGYWTIGVTMFVFYVFVSLELIAEEIEDPFGNDDNDLPTDDLSEKIYANIDEIVTK